MRNEDRDILDSWGKNAQSWIEVIEGGRIESRHLVTNGAIEEAILHDRPAGMLDLGCGQGWLTHRLQASGIAAHGIDATEQLTRAAQRQRGATFAVQRYEDLIAGKPIQGQPFEAVVINFALFGEKTTEKLLYSLHLYLKGRRLLFIQTLHPQEVIGERPYQSGWLEGSWEGLDGHFTQPHLWYFRTLDDWASLLKKTKFNLEKVIEPLHPATGRPASVIFVARA